MTFTQFNSSIDFTVYYTSFQSSWSLANSSLLCSEEFRLPGFGKPRSRNLGCPLLLNKMVTGELGGVKKIITRKKNKEIVYFCLRCNIKGRRAKP